MADVEKRRKTIINVAYFAIIIALAVVAIRYALGVCLPFVMAFVFATILQRPKNFLVKKTPLKSGIASTICVFFALFVFVSLIVLIGVRIVNEIKDFVNYIVLQLKDFDSVVDTVETWLLNLSASLPEFIRKTVTESIGDIFTQLRASLAGKNSDAVNQVGSAIAGGFSLSWIKTPISGVITTAKQVPSVLIAVIVSIVACCFMTNEYSEIMNLIKMQFPKHRRKDLTRAKAILKSSLGKMGKAYLLIMFITFVEMSIGLTILRLLRIFDSNFIVIIAAITAIVDIVPVLGTGTVLIPWALYSFISGNIGMGIGLAVIYVVITVIRQVIEPKLVAGQLGLSPVITIASLYFGLKIFGVLGMLITPILVIMIKLLNDEGIIKLWRSPVSIKAAKEAEKKGDNLESEPEPAEK